MQWKSFKSAPKDEVILTKLGDHIRPALWDEESQTWILAWPIVDDVKGLRAKWKHYHRRGITWGKCKEQKVRRSNATS